VLRRGNAVTAVRAQAAVAPQAWERIRDGVRSRLAAFLQRRPGLSAALPRVRAWALWTALTWALVMVVVFPKYRDGI
jgi:hypothetical protein